MSLKYTIIRTSYNIEYCRHGRLHRMDGYAIMWGDGYVVISRYGKTIHKKYVTEDM